MKQSIKFITASAIYAFASFTAGNAQARETIIAISPFGTKAEKLADIKTLARFMSDVTDAGETSILIDGYNLSEVARFTVPDNAKRFKNIRAKMRANPLFFADVKRFAEKITQPNESQFVGQINFPGMLRMLSTGYRTDKPRSLVFYKTSPINDTPDNPTLSMKDGVIPDDDHIASSRADTPYGAAEQAGELRNYTWHWGFGDAGWIVSDRHQYFMERYIGRNASIRGAILASFASDPDTALRNAKNGIDTSLGVYAPQMDEKLQMMRFRSHEEASQKEDEEPLVQEKTEEVPIYERVLSERKPQRVELRRANNVEMAIRWTCACDFDLAVKNPDGDIISFRSKESSNGKLLKDHTSSQSLNNGWETVALNGSDIDLGSLTLGINLFSSAVSGQEVELRIAINGETWGKTYVISGSGNGGDGFADTLQNGVAANASWIVPDVISVAEGR